LLWIKQDIHQAVLIKHFMNIILIFNIQAHTVELETEMTAGADKEVAGKFLKNISDDVRNTQINSNDFKTYLYFMKLNRIICKQL
jgi:hypothetical protein